MDMEQMNKVMTQLAVQEEKMESINEKMESLLVINKDMQKSLERMNSEVSDIKADNKLTKHRLDDHEAKLLAVKEETFRNTRDVLSLQSDTESTLRTIKFVGSVFMAIATLAFGIIGVVFR